MTNTSNIYRKARALVAKTEANGCTIDEAISAANLASKIITEHNLNPVLIDWPAPPTGYGWEREPGRGGTMVARPVEKTAKPKRTRATKPKGESKPKAKKGTVGDRLEKMLRRPGGVTIAEMMSEFGILAHSARAVISVEKRKRGLNVSLDRETGRYSVA